MPKVATNPQNIPNCGCDGDTADNSLTCPADMAELAQQLRAECFKDVDMKNSEQVRSAKAALADALRKKGIKPCFACIGQIDAAANQTEV